MTNKIFSNKQLRAMCVCCDVFIYQIENKQNERTANEKKTQTE